MTGTLVIRVRVIYANLIFYLYDIPLIDCMANLLL